MCSVARCFFAAGTAPARTRRLAAPDPSLAALRSSCSASCSCLWCSAVHRSTLHIHRIALLRSRHPNRSSGRFDKVRSERRGLGARAPHRSRCWCLLEASSPSCFSSAARISLLAAAAAARSSCSRARREGCQQNPSRCEQFRRRGRLSAGFASRGAPARLWLPSFRDEQIAPGPKG